MRLDEIEIKTPSPSKIIGDELTDKQYRKIIADLKVHEVGNKSASRAMKQVMSMWEKGDKLIHNYKSIIDEIGIKL